MRSARARNLSTNVRKTFFMTNGKPTDKPCDSSEIVTLEGTGGVTTMLKSRIMIRVGRIGGCVSSIMSGDSRWIVVMDMDSRGMMMMKMMIRLKVRVVVTMATVIVVTKAIIVRVVIIVPKVITHPRISSLANHRRRIEGPDPRGGNRDWHGYADTVDDDYRVDIACKEPMGSDFAEALKKLGSMCMS